MTEHTKARQPRQANKPSEPVPSKYRLLKPVVSKLGAFAGFWLDLSVLFLTSLVSRLGTFFGVEEPECLLSQVISSTQQAQLDQVFRGGLDFDPVRIRYGGWVYRLGGDVAKAVGNTVYLGRREIDRDQHPHLHLHLREQGLKTLIHELAHVWQFQTGGRSYLHRALFAQFSAYLRSGSRNQAYDWRRARIAGQGFRDMNPESQAAAIEDAGWALTQHGSFDEAVSLGLLSHDHADFLRATLDEVKRGPGSDGQDAHALP